MHVVYLSKMLFVSVPKGGKEKHRIRDKNDNTISGRGVSGEAHDQGQSSYSSSPEDGEPQSPQVLTEHGLPTLSRRYEMKREESDPDFYRPTVAIAKLPGILPDEQEVIEATCRGYRSFDAELTQEEVTALGQLSLHGGGAEAPVIMIESPEGVVSDPQEDSGEEELEIYEPEEIEMSELASQGSGGSVGDDDLGLADADGTEMTAFEQETQLNGDVETISSEESSEENDEDVVQDSSHSGAQEESGDLGPTAETSRSNNIQEAENGRASPDKPRVRSMSFGFEETLKDDRFEEPEKLPSPIKKFHVSELERPGSPALFQYRAKENQDEAQVHEADDKTVFTFEPIDPSHGTATNGSQEKDSQESD